MALTEAELDRYLDVVKRWLMERDRATVEISLKNGRMNIVASKDEVLVQNGKILGSEEQ